MTTLLPAELHHDRGSIHFDGAELLFNLGADDGGQLDVAFVRVSVVSDGLVQRKLHRDVAQTPRAVRAGFLSSVGRVPSRDPGSYVALERGRVRDRTRDLPVTSRIGNASSSVVPRPAVNGTLDPLDVVDTVKHFEALFDVVEVVEEPAHATLRVDNG